MADLPETDEFPEGVYQIETTDPVVGGAPNAATGAGMANIPHQHLAARTRWLKTRVDQLLGLVVAATGSVAGIVKLSTAINSTSTTTAATPSAVKAANDNAETRALKTITLTASGLAVGGGNLTANRVINVPIATQAEAEAGASSTKAMTPLRVAQAMIAALSSYVPSARTITAGDGMSGGGTLGANRSFAVDGSVVRTARNILAGGLATGGGALSADRTITVPAATQAEAQAGASNTVAMTPLRTKQAIAALMGGLVAAAGFAASFGDGGYVKFPAWLGGWILQWGGGTVLNTDGAAGSRMVFPVSFPSACFRVVPTGNSVGGAIGNCSTVVQIARDKSGFYAVAERNNAYQSSAVHYIAIGN